MTEIPRMLTIRQCSQETGISYERIRQLCLQKKIVHFRAGNKYLVNLDKFIDFLNTGEGQQDA